MQNSPQRSITEILDAYRDYLLLKVGKVRILGEAGERELKDIFVELSIVEQRKPQRHAELLSMMDSAMRRRFNLPEISEQRRKEAKRRVKPDHLLQRRTKVIVTGAPGCGKTTLLKYLALQSQEKEKRLAVWLELKAIIKPLFAQAEKAAAGSGNLILQELWLKHIKPQLSLSHAEIELLRGHWQDKFKANEIIVLLDGFDELQDEAVELSLNKCVREFVSAAHENTLLISTRPYAQHKLGKERLQELEIEPLNQSQIEAFLNCYYPNDTATKSLLKTLRERSSLRELLHVPLLLGVILRLHREDRFDDERLKLYETIVTDLVHELDRSKSVNRLFKVSDKRFLLDFLKFLAFERLLRDSLDESEQEVSRFVFNYDVLKAKARNFLTQESSSYNARDLADDALATPLLREVSTNTYAFAHLTLQEYLAACTFAAFLQKKGNEIEALKIFCHAYHTPTLVGMEVLPMTLGVLPNADKLYDEIERWPESLDFLNLRLRARGLAYQSQIRRERLLDLIDRLLEFVLMVHHGETPYRNMIISSFTGISRQMVNLIEAKAASLAKTDIRSLFNVDDALARLSSKRGVEALISALTDGETIIRRRAAISLGELGVEQAVAALTSALNDTDNDVLWRVVDALEEIGSEQAVETLISALNHHDSIVRYRAAEKLGELGTARAVAALTSALNNDDYSVRRTAAKKLRNLGSEQAVTVLVSALNSGDTRASYNAVEALVEIGSEQAAEVLISALNNHDSIIRDKAAEKLGEIGSEQAILALTLALNDENIKIRLSAAEALVKLGSEKAVEVLTSALNHDDVYVRINAAAALGKLCSEEVVAELIFTLKDGDNIIRWMVIDALKEIGSDQSAPALISALNDDDSDIRSHAAEALGETGSEQAVVALISALRDNDKDVRSSATEALGKIGSEQAIAALISALNHDDYFVRSNAISALGEIGSKQAVEALIPALAFTGNDGFLGRKAAEALGRLGSEQAVAALLSALNQDDRYVSSSVAWALAQIKVDALISGLARAFKYGDSWTRKKAVGLIGYYSNDRQTLAQLKQIAQTDENNNVRDAAKEAAEKFARKLELLGHFITEGTTQRLSDNESRELFLVGEVFRVVAEAGHIFRQTSNSDWGIDGEIEFKNVKGEASGQRVYLQLKSGDSYLRTRKSDGKEIFTIKKTRHVEYWQSHAYPVLLVIRDSGGQIRWMNMTEYLQRQGAGIKQIEFQGEPFTAESVNQMRARFFR